MTLQWLIQIEICCQLMIAEGHCRHFFRIKLIWKNRCYLSMFYTLYHKEFSYLPNYFLFLSLKIKFFKRQVKYEIENILEEL